MNADIFRPHNPALKKYVLEMLKESYGKHEGVLERCLTAIATKEDAESFAALMHSIYSAGYRRAMNECREQLEQVGYHLNLVSQTSADNPK